MIPGGSVTTPAASAVEHMTTFGSDIALVRRGRPLKSPAGPGQTAKTAPHSGGAEAGQETQLAEGYVMEAQTDHAPTLARRIIDLPGDATNVFVGMIAGHFATATELDRQTVERYIDESVATA